MPTDSPRLKRKPDTRDAEAVTLRELLAEDAERVSDPRLAEWLRALSCEETSGTKT